MRSDEVMVAIISAGALLSGVAVIMVGLNYRVRMRELRHKERLAMIERGLLPAPEFEGGAAPAASKRSLSLGIIVVGLGLGLATSPTLIAAQSSVDWAERGVVTGTNMFARSMGSAVGVAVFGAIVNASLGDRIGGHSSTAAGIPPSALDSALHQVFVAAAVVAALLLVAVALMPRTPAKGLTDSA